MNDLTPISAGGAVLAAIDEPLNQYRQLLPLIKKVTYSELMPLDGREPAEHRDEALERLELIPPATVLYRAIECMRVAAYGETREDETRILVAAAFEAYPNAQKVNSAALIEQLLDILRYHDLKLIRGAQGFSPTVIRGALRHVLAENKFVPSIAEILEAALKVQVKLRNAEHPLSLLIERRENAEDILIATGDLKFDHDNIPF
jgi:hypothetical protein